MVEVQLVLKDQRSPEMDGNGIPIQSAPLPRHSTMPSSTATGKRFDSQSLFKSIPPNVDPFAYIASAEKTGYLSTSSGSIEILLVLLFFHTLVVLFCLFILIKSAISRTKNFRWLCKTLYIKDSAGRQVYNSPLYFFNAGILMTVMQLLSSACAQGYIWIQIKSSLSVDYALHNQVMLFLGPMNMFESVCHWSMSHCFLVTVYFARGFDRGMKTAGVMGMISPPVFFNFLFIFFPVCVVFITAATFGWMSVTHKHLVSKVLELMGTLKQASSDWKRLHDAAHQSAKEMAQIGHQLATIQKKIGDEMSPLVENWVYSFHSSLCMLFGLVCITSVVFILLSYLLIQRYQLERRRASASLNDSPWLNEAFLRSTRSIQSSSQNPRNTPTLRSNKQYLYLLFRAFGVFLSMITQTISLLIGIIKTHDVVMNKHWRGVFTWLATICGVWSAVPIAFQCWRLYADQTDSGFSDSTDSSTASHTFSESTSQCCTSDQSCESDIPELEIKLLSPPMMELEQKASLEILGY